MDNDSAYQQTLDYLYSFVDFSLNAGIGLYGPFAATAWKEVEKVLRTNIDGAMGVTRMVIPQMLARRKGSIEFVSSVLGKRAIPWSTVYCASKQALHGFADGLRLEVRRHGVHVGIVAPAHINGFFQIEGVLCPADQAAQGPRKLAGYRGPSYPEKCTGEKAGNRSHLLRKAILLFRLSFSPLV